MIDDLVGREMIGFSSSHYTYAQGMDRYVGKIGKIVSNCDDCVYVRYSNDGLYPWSYVKEEAIHHLVEEEPEIDLKQLFNNIQKL